MIIKTRPNATYTGYFSHHIRGKKGTTATDEDMRHNIDEARRVGHLIMEKYPNIDLHIPGDHDEFVCVGHRMELLSEEAILEIDCGIIKQRDFVIAYAYDQHISRGMRVEINYAKDHKTPTFLFTDWDEETEQSLHEWLRRRGYVHE